MSNIDNLRECSIDSLKIRIPLFALESYDETISRELIVSCKDTAEIDREYKETRKVYNFDCFSLTANVFDLKGTTYLFLLVNSKQLQENYFKGITINTIKTIYHLCIEANIFQCSFNVFTQGLVTDIDFKKDFYLVLSDYKEMNGGLYKMTKVSSHRDKGARLHPNNMGIEFSSRNAGSITNPFTKVYHKETELDQNSWEFSDRYLNGIDYKNIIRIETTIKDKKHLHSAIGKQIPNTLENVLNLTIEDKNKIMANGFNRHLLPRTNHKVYSKQGLTSRQLMDLQTLDILVNQCNFTFDNAINEMLSTQNNKNSKYKLKKAITKLYNDHINQVNYTEKSLNINSIYDSIGWK